MILTYTFAEALGRIPVGATVTVTDGDVSTIGTVASFDTVAQAMNVAIPGGVRHFGADTTAAFNVDTAALEAAPAAADAALIKDVEASQEQTELGEMSATRRIAAMLTWAELQDFTANQAAILGLTVEQRAKRIPFLHAFKTETGATWAAVATAIDNRLWPVVRRTALFEARSVLAKDRVRNATTVAAKIAAANVSWSDTP